MRMLIDVLIERSQEGFEFAQGVRCIWDYRIDPCSVCSMAQSGANQEEADQETLCDRCSEPASVDEDGVYVVEIFRTQDGFS